MKKILVLISVALLFGALALTSCNKTQKEDPTDVLFEVADITATTATVNISITGAKPMMLRYTAPVALESIDFNPDDQTALAEYGSKGTAIGLPYVDKISNLSPVTEYIAVAVAYDEAFQAVCVKYFTFTTATPENAIGDEAGAGEIGNERW